MRENEAKLPRTLEMVWRKLQWGEKGGKSPWHRRRVLQSLFSIKQSFPHLVLEGSSTLYAINREMAHKSLHYPPLYKERVRPKQNFYNSKCWLTRKILQRKPALLCSMADRVGDGVWRVYLAIMRTLPHILGAAANPGLDIGNIKHRQISQQNKYRFLDLGKELGIFGRLKNAYKR